MQAGRIRTGARRWIFPTTASCDRPLAGSASTIGRVGADTHPVVEHADLKRRSSAFRWDAVRTRGLAWGRQLRGERTVSIAYFGEGPHRRRLHRGQLGGGVKAPAILVCNNNSGRSRPRSRRDRSGDARRQGLRLRHSPGGADGGDVMASTTRHPGQSSGTRGEGPTSRGVRYRRPRMPTPMISAYIDMSGAEERDRCLGGTGATRAGRGAERDLDEQISGRRCGDEGRNRRRRRRATADAEILFKHALVTPPGRSTRLRAWRIRG